MSHDERSFFAGRQQGQRACEKEMEVMAALLDQRTAEIRELIQRVERLTAQASAQALLVSDNDHLCREVERLQGEMVRGNEIVAELQEESSYTQALERQLLEARAENERLRADIDGLRTMEGRK